jgi:trigger factor
MEANVEEVGALERRLDVSIPQEKIKTEVENRLKRLARTAKIHGFRPGKVPLKIVQQQYGPQIRQEVIGDELKRNFGEVIREKNLRVAGYPRFEPKNIEENASAFEFSATFEVYPDIVLGDLGSARIERPVVSVAEGDVSRTIETLRKQRVHYEPVQRPAEKGDQITIDYRGTIEGQEFSGSQAENFTLVLGQGRLLKDFEDSLLGMSTGESRTFEVNFPPDYHGKEAAGKTAVFEVKLHEVKAPQLPELNAEFAKSLGIADGDIEKLRGEVQANLEREVSNRVRARMKEQVMQCLLDIAKSEAPKALVEIERERLMDDARRDLATRGMNKNMPLPPELFNERAERRVKLGLILAEVVKLHGLQPKPEQVRAIVEDIAQSYEDPAEVVKWHYAVPERLNEAESLALEENVVTWVLEKATVEDKPVMFDELMGRAA